jgi:hypothetical protein
MVDLFWESDRLLKAECKSKKISRDIGPLFRIFGFWDM